MIKLLCFLLAVGNAAAACAGVLQLTTVDERGSKLPCRVLVRPERGACVVPADAVTLKSGPDTWFISPGEVEIAVPEGTVELRVEQGHEYERIKEQFSIVAAATKKQVQLRRWINLRERGYRSGENHLHVGGGKVGPMMIAEGIDFGAALTWWNGPERGVPFPPGQGRTRTLSFGGRDATVSVFDGELEYGWGAAYFINLPEPMPLQSNPKRPNLDYLKYAIESGGFVHYQAGYSREVVVDALLGCVHVVNLCSNNFQLHRYQPRSRYSNLLNIDGFRIYPNTDIGMMQLSTDSYYRLLNCGLRLAAGAESATGVKQAPAGYNRAYVRVAEPANIDEFYRAWAAGRNFVTNGPALFLTVDENHLPGDTIELPDTSRVLKVAVTAVSNLPLTSVEIVVNGDVVSSLEPGSNDSVTGRIELDVRRSSWIAARCTARDDLLTDAELGAFANGEMQQPSRLRFAHTSPVYVTVGGKRPAVAKSIAECAQILEHFAMYAKKEASPEYLPAILQAVTVAQDKLERSPASLLSVP